MSGFARAAHRLTGTEDPKIPGARITPHPALGHGLSLDEEGKIPKDIQDGRIRHVFTAGQHVNSFTDTGTSMGAVAIVNCGRIFIMDAKAIYESGLRPQLAVHARMNNSNAGVTTRARAALYEVADGDTGVNGLLGGTAVTHVGTTATYKVGAWEDINLEGTALTDPHWQVIAETSVSANTGTYTDLGICFRWA